MVLGFHVILSTYGFWLPNDPRGSWSDFVRKWELHRFGPATKVNIQQSVAGTPHNRELRLAAKEALSHPPVRLNGRQALAVAHGFDHARSESGYVIYACAIMPDHAHLVIARLPRTITRVAGHLKTRAKQAMVNEGLWPANRELWAHRCWKVFLFTPEDVERAIKYLENNPLKEGKPRQHWSFVTPYSRI